MTSNNFKVKNGIDAAGTVTTPAVSTTDITIALGGNVKYKKETTTNATIKIQKVAL